MNVPHDRAGAVSSGVWELKVYSTGLTFLRPVWPSIWVSPWAVKYRVASLLFSVSRVFEDLKLQSFLSVVIKGKSSLFTFGTYIFFFESRPVCLPKKNVQWSSQKVSSTTEWILKMKNFHVSYSFKQFYSFFIFLFLSIEEIRYPAFICSRALWLSIHR